MDDEDAAAACFELRIRPTSSTYASKPNLMASLYFDHASSRDSYVNRRTYLAFPLATGSITSIAYTIFMCPRRPTPPLRVNMPGRALISGDVPGIGPVRSPLDPAKASISPRVCRRMDSPIGLGRSTTGVWRDPIGAPSSPEGSRVRVLMSLR